MEFQPEDKSLSVTRMDQSYSVIMMKNRRENKPLEDSVSEVFLRFREEDELSETLHFLAGVLATMLGFAFPAGVTVSPEGGSSVTALMEDGVVSAFSRILSGTFSGLSQVLGQLVVKITTSRSHLSFLLPALCTVYITFEVIADQQLR